MNRLAIPEHVRFLMIGSGPTGLGAAHRLAGLGERDFLLLEAGDRVGGLAASYTDERGFTWDVGGHVQFSHFGYFDRVMDEALPPGDWLQHQRAASVWLQGRFVPYPFQNNLHHLPVETAWRCLEGLLAAREAAAADAVNFQEWILASFGRGIADIFMLPYNHKVWAFPAERLAQHWVAERVSRPDFRQVLESFVLRRDDPGWGPNNSFRFPRRGGTGAAWEGVADGIGREHIRLGTRVVGISARTREVSLEDGRRIRFEHLLSTLPLDRLAAMVEELPACVADRARQLSHSSTHVVGIGLRGQPPESLAARTWIYFPERDCPFYRATVFSNYSRENVPDPERQWSLLTETSASADKPLDEAANVRDTLDGLLATQLVRSLDDVESVWSHSVDYGYPTPTVERDAILGDVQGALEALGVASRGRFGAWRYEVSNQDHSLMQGVEWVNRVLLGEPETVFTAL